MACVIAAPSSGSGKTLLSIALAAWARSIGLRLQPFKVGPDYLDSQQLTAASGLQCRNLDLLICGSSWVRNCFHSYGGRADLALVEGVMGLFDGVGPSAEGSTASVAAHLQLPVVLLVDGSGQANSIAALVRGFIEQDPNISFAGVVLNRVNTLRHKELLTEVLNGISVKVLGCLPSNPSLTMSSRHLGLSPAHEQQIELRLDLWSSFAEENLDLVNFRSILQPPSQLKNPIDELRNYRDRSSFRDLPVAVAHDEAFHFTYPETKDCLEALGMPVILWRPLDDEPIPKDAKGVIIPGGFPEQHAERLSKCLRAISALQENFGRKPIYAECGGMLLLGNTLCDLEGIEHTMSGILPFSARRGPLHVGYRRMEGIKDSLLVKKGEVLIGHEFHRWQLNRCSQNNFSFTSNEYQSQEIFDENIWEVSGWKVERKVEGWSNKYFHASWIHMHWASSPKIALRLRSKLQGQS